MVAEETVSTGQRLADLLDALGVERAHFVATRGIDSLTSLNLIRPEAIASVTVLSPPEIEPQFLQQHRDHFVAMFGSAPYPGKGLGRSSVGGLPDGRLVELPNAYPAYVWSDVAADLREWLAGKLSSFIDSIENGTSSRAITLPGKSGSVSGISYRANGSGPPLILLPLGLARSQWAPLAPELENDHCVIQLGGPWLGVLNALFNRIAQPSYRAAIDRLFGRLGISPGERLLEVGCGPGAVAIELARQTGGQNEIVATDVNQYLMDEAKQITATEGFSNVIEILEGDALELPFEDDSFDVVFAATVLEEVEADIALSEMVRVCRPGGRVGAVVRCNDLPWYWHLNLDPELLAFVNVPQDAPGSEGAVSMPACTRASSARVSRPLRLSRPGAPRGRPATTSFRRRFRRYLPKRYPASSMRSTSGPLQERPLCLFRTIARSESSRDRVCGMRPATARHASSGAGTTKVRCSN